MSCVVFALNAGTGEANGGAGGEAGNGGSGDF